MKVIDDLIKQPLKLNGNYERPLEYFEDMNPKIVDDNLVRGHLWSKSNAILEYYREALGWIRANPSIPDVSAAIRYSYVWPKHDPYDGNSYANTKANFSSFWHSLIDFSSDVMRKDVYITGKKGVGKTHFINYVLNTFTKRLKDNNIMWYRVDASQVYQRKLKLLIYFYLQVIYVSLKYPNAVKYLNLIYDKHELFINHLKAHRDPVSLENYEYVYEKYLNIVKSARDLEIEKPSVIDSVHKNLFQNVFLKQRNMLEQREVYQEVEFLGKAILSFLVTRGIKLILIFDGIDNVDYIKGRTQYSEFIQELINSIGLGILKPKVANSKIVIACRRETYSHIRYEAQTYGEPIMYEIKPLCINDIVKNKISKAVCAGTPYFNSKKRYAEIGIEKDKRLKRMALTPIKFDNWLAEFGSDFVSTIFQHLKDLGIPQFNGEDDILLYVYNNNIRSFIHNLLNAYEYKILFEAKKRLINRPYAYIEGMFLDGLLLYDSKRLPLRNSDLINIFYYENTSISQIWHGLCGLRMLTLLKTCGPHTKEQIRVVLHQMVDYHPEIVEQFVQRYVQSGLIAPRYRAKEPLKYYIMPKGILFSVFIFKNMDYLYSLCLDSPLLYQAVANSNMIDIHEKFWKHYSECAVKSVITMMRHIFTQINSEKTMILEKIRNHEIATSDVSNAFVNCNPQFENIISSISLVINRLDKNRKEELITKLRGLLIDRQQMEIYFEES